MQRTDDDFMKWKASHQAVVSVVTQQLVRHSPYTFDRLLALQADTRLALVRRVAERTSEPEAELAAVGHLYTGSRDELRAECEAFAKIHRHEARRAPHV